MKLEIKEGRRLLFACAHFRKRMRALEPLKISDQIIEAAKLYGIDIKTKPTRNKQV